jgi:hypothetical protein
MSVAFMLYPYELVDFGTQMLDLPVTFNHSNAGSNFVNAVMVVIWICCIFVKQCRMLLSKKIVKHVSCTAVHKSSNKQTKHRLM